MAAISRLRLALQRLKNQIHSSHELVVAARIYGQLLSATVELFVFRKPFNTLLKARAARENRLSWPAIKSLMRGLIPFVPVGRHHRCLVMSIVGYRYFAAINKRPSIEIGVIERQSKLAFHARLKGESGNVLLDTDPHVEYKRLCSLQL
jgi:hypothetical protein